MHCGVCLSRPLLDYSRYRRYLVRMDTALFERFAPILKEYGASAVGRPELSLATQPPYEVRYIPFEYVNGQARLVIVGITPGTTQLELAYAEAQRLLNMGVVDIEILRSVKDIAGFGGSAMRPNLLRMLRHFNFANLLGIQSEDDLWGSAAHLLHATSVVPNAAFKKGKMFSGSFAEIMKADVLREQYAEQLIPSLKEMPPDAMYVALGRTVLDALRYCVDIGLIRDSQLLGAFPHPSRSAGSQVSIYLGEIEPEALKASDPVRHRVPWLIEARERMQNATSSLLQGL